MGENWSKEDHDKAVEFRREVSGYMQEARRNGSPLFAWFYGKMADFALWIERESKRLMRGF